MTRCPRKCFKILQVDFDFVTIHLQLKPSVFRLLELQYIESGRAFASIVINLKRVHGRPTCGLRSESMGWALADLGIELTGRAEVGWLPSMSIVFARTRDSAEYSSYFTYYCKLGRDGSTLMSSSPKVKCRVLSIILSLSFSLLQSRFPLFHVWPLGGIERHRNCGGALITSRWILTAR